MGRPAHEGVVLKAPAGNGALQEIARDVRAEVDAVADEPEGRLELRKKFYLKYGRADELQMDDPYGYGRSELNFMAWEVRRGVLDPVRAVGGGSPWWRGVNGDFLYYSALAGAAHEAGLATDDGLPEPSVRWVEFITTPSAKAWYRAHNASIVAGYQNRKKEAEAERRAEQIFVNEVLYRLLYAQGLIEGVEMGRLGELLAHPGLPSVDVMVHLPDFYPDDYPLSRQDIRHVLHEGHCLGEWASRLLDDILIHPQLMRLYGQASDWLPFPPLREYCVDGEPVYPALDPFSWPHHLISRVICFGYRIIGAWKSR